MFFQRYPLFSIHKRSYKYFLYPNSKLCRFILNKVILFTKTCYKTGFFYLLYLEISRKSVSLQCVFHSIRFKVNKGWSTAVLLFLCPYLSCTYPSPFNLPYGMGEITYLFNHTICHCETFQRTCLYLDTNNMDGAIGSSRQLPFSCRSHTKPVTCF